MGWDGMVFAASATASTGQIKRLGPYDAALGKGSNDPGTLSTLNLPRAT